VGGGAENLPWVRMKASITGRTYQVMERKDAAPLGSALIAAFGSGKAALGDLIKRYVRVEREIEPELKYGEQYGRLFESYGRIYGKVREEMKILAEERTFTEERSI
jgi:xylulokinase